MRKFYKKMSICVMLNSDGIILSVIAGFLKNPDRTKVYTYTKNWDGEDSDVYIVALRNKSGEMIGYYEKHESRIHEGKRASRS